MGKVVSLMRTRDIIKREPLELGDPNILHRHRCEVCHEIFECQPCPHFPRYQRSETIPRVCRQHQPDFEMWLQRKKVGRG